MRILSTTPRFSLSLSEHKILLAFGFLLCGFYFTNISDKAIATYNENVKNEQLEKQRIADNESGFSFDVCIFRSAPIYEIILGFQFLLLPLLFFLLKGQNLKRFISSQLLTFLILLGYIGWMVETYDLVISEIKFIEEDRFFNNYILYQSTILEVTIFLTLAVLFTTQSVFLMRFVIEKFQAKIS